MLLNVGKTQLWLAVMGAPNALKAIKSISGYMANSCVSVSNILHDATLSVT